MGYDNHGSDSPFFVSPRTFFSEMVTTALEQRRIKTLPFVQGYLVELLEYYVPTANLYDVRDSSGKRTKETLAEIFLKAQSADSIERNELLKKLADRSLYISGFFGDSLQRKLIDIDYYVEMGCSAYDALSSSVRESTLSKTYQEFAHRFLEFVEVLTIISSQSKVQSEENILRLYETYARTGSDLAREKLIAKGLIAIPIDSSQLKKSQ